jgi:cytidine deaminase
MKNGEKGIYLSAQPFFIPMELTRKDKELIEKAERLVGEKKVSGGVVKEVGSALLTKNGEIFTGANLDLWCGIGFCAEHSAIAHMISHSDETQITSIVAVYYDTKDETFKIIPPCGRCREMMELIDKRNRENTNVIVSENKKMKLKELLPAEWM